MDPIHQIYQVDSIVDIILNIIPLIINSGVKVFEYFILSLYACSIDFETELRFGNVNGERNICIQVLRENFPAVFHCVFGPIY